MILRDKFFINGQWATPSAKETIDVHNAGTGEVMGKVPAGTEKDIEAAVAAARAALEGWSATPRREARGVPAEDLRRTEGARRGTGLDHRAGSRHADQARRPHPGRVADREFRELRKDCF